MNISRRGFFSFLAGAAVPTVIAGGIIRVGGLIVPDYPTMEFDLGDTTELLLTGQSWFLVGRDKDGNVTTEQIPWDRVMTSSTNPWQSEKQWRSISGSTALAEDKYYLTTDKHPRIPGKLLAIITRGHSQRGDMTVVVCSMEVVNDEAEARDWMRQQMELMPWLSPEELALEAAKQSLGLTKH